MTKDTVVDVFGHCQCQQLIGERRSMQLMERRGGSRMMLPDVVVVASSDPQISSSAAAAADWARLLYGWPTTLDRRTVLRLLLLLLLLLLRVLLLLVLLVVVAVRLAAGHGHATGCWWRDWWLYDCIAGRLWLSSAKTRTCQSLSVAQSSVHRHTTALWSLNGAALTQSSQ